MNEFLEATPTGDLLPLALSEVPGDYMIVHKSGKMYSGPDLQNLDVEKYDLRHLDVEQYRVVFKQETIRELIRRCKYYEDELDKINHRLEGLLERLYRLTKLTDKAVSNG